MALVMAYAGAKALKKAHDQKRARDMEDDEPDWGNFEPMDWDDEISEKDRLKKELQSGMPSPPRTPSIIELDGAPAKPAQNSNEKLRRLTRRWSDPGKRPDVDKLTKAKKQHESAGHERTQSAQNPPKQPTSPLARKQTTKPRTQKPLPSLPDTPPPRDALPYPVIIPQRRPESDDRGFAYAYAPILNDSGIDEDTFVEFLFHLNEACKASATYDVVNTAILTKSMKADFITQMYGAATAIAKRAAKSTHSEEKVNRYLANSNNTIFNPKGLFCLIVKYKPDEQMSKAQNALRNGHSLVKTKALDRLGILEDIPSGDSIPQLPPSAPLIFTSAPSKDKGLKRAVTRRHDRKAQENYVLQMLTGGVSGKPANPQLAILYGRRDLMQEPRSNIHHADDGRSSRRFPMVPHKRSQSQSPTPGSSVRDSIRRDPIRSEPARQDALYLLVINMPSNSEIDSYNKEAAATCPAPNFF